jgi:hypothetical protein
LRTEEIAYARQPIRLQTYLNLITSFFPSETLVKNNLSQRNFTADDINETIQTYMQSE